MSGLAVFGASGFIMISATVLAVIELNSAGATPTVDHAYHVDRIRKRPEIEIRSS